jgi:hypothetical protein
VTHSAASGPLRQGDICALPAFPVWDIDRTQRQVGGNSASESFVMPRHRVLEWDELTGSVAVAICSHDCDLENPRERTGILVAPVVKVPARPGDDRYERIMTSGDTSVEINYAHLFPVTYAAGESDVEAVIDFSAMTSLAKAENAVRHLLNSRVLGCGDETRSSIGRKLALFLGRPYQDPR